MPELVQHLHYRIVDVSSIKEMVKRWYGQEAVWLGQGKIGDKGEHRALSDTNGSIAELKWYREQYFKSKPEL